MMSRYRYKALAASGELVNGNLPAASKDDAFMRLRQMGYIPLQANPEAAAGRGRGIRRMFQTRKSVPLSEVLVFTRELSVLLKAGISVDRAFDNLIAAHTPGPLRLAMRRISDAIKSGHTLSAALSKHDDIFPSFYVGLVRAGEAGGSLPDVLDQIAGSLENSEKLREQLRASLLYPLIVLIMVGFSFVIMMVWVIPEFRPLLEGHGNGMSFSAKAVLSLSGLTVNWGWLFGLCALLLAVAMKLLLKDEKLLRLRDRRLLAAPVVGDLIKHLETARFCRSLGVLIANGVPLLDGIDVAGGAVANRALAGTLRSTRTLVSRGEGLATALRRTAELPDLFVQLIGVGEESGRLTEMLWLSAEDAEKKAQKTIHRLVTLLVPLVTVWLGLLVATMIGTIISAVMGSYNVAL